MTEQPGLQLNLLGIEDRPEDLELGSVQRAVMRALRERGTIARDEAGAIAHASRGKHTADETCAWCAIDGAPILAALIKRGRAVRAPEGHAQLPRTRQDADTGGPGDLPEGF